MINLCCAQSVHRVVEEVARSLERLGFEVTVVCGAEARAALLGSRTDAEQPTIHVVCVQGSMQERVLKPLRQALATHGGPNHHLFVAVLDLGVPLAMVGQIRRFAEALERTAPASGAATSPGVVAPTGREPSSAHRDLEQAPTRAYPSLTQVVERGGTKPPLAPEGEDASNRPPRRPLGARPRVAKLVPTSKYQAVTASHPIVPTEPGVRKRRRVRSRLSPSARRRPAEERVLGLPEQESRHTAAPRREPPLPPLASSEPARRASTPPPPPPSRSPSSTSLLTADADDAATVDSATTPRLRPTGGKAPERAAAGGAPEADRAVPRPGGFRFTPPGVKAAEPPRAPDGPIPTVPLAEVLRDPDKTVVEGVLAEVPRTASTLRLDEPPFQGGRASRSGRPAERDAASGDDEPVEPTMIMPSPVGSHDVEDAEEIEEIEEVEEVEEVEAIESSEPAEPVEPTIIAAPPAPPPTTGTTVVGPPPKPSPATLAELERGQREAGTKGADTAASAGPRKTIGYLQRDEPAKPSNAAPAFERATTPVSESSRTLLHQPKDDAGDARGSEPARELVQRPVGSPRDTPLSSESSGTLVLRPRTAGTALDDDDLAAIATPASADTAASTEDEGFESAQTLLRDDGTFARSSDVLQRIEPSRTAPATTPSPSSPTTVTATAPTTPAAAEPSDAGARELAGKPSKTVLYADSSSPPTPAADARPATPSAPRQGSTVVGPAPTSAAPAEPKPTPAASKPSADTSAAPPSSSPTPAAEADSPRSAERRGAPPSAIPTERHPVAAPSPAERSRGRRAPSAPVTKRRADPRAGVLRSDSPTPAAAPRDAAARPRRKRSASNYGWVWILLALLGAGGGFGAYQAGLFDGLLGRGRPSDAAIADASRTPDPATTPAADTPGTPAAEAGAVAADAGETKAAAASTGSDDGASTDATAGQAAMATTPATAGDPTSGDQAAAASSGEPEPAAAESTGGDDPGPDEPAADGGAPDEPAADGGTPDEPPTTGGTPVEPPTPNVPDEPAPGTGPQLSPEEQQLTPAVDARRIFMLKTLYTTKRQGTATSFAGGWQRCAKLEVDGVKGWRLPHRREMKLVNAVLSLPAGLYWTRTVPDDDKSAAYVLDSTNGQLSLSLKQEPTGEVVCVRERDFPEK